MSDKLTHFDADGKPRMVDVSGKDVSARIAVASGAVLLSAKALEIVKSGNGKKGDAIAVAELAGIMAAKKTSELIPLCHPLPISGVKIDTETEGDAVRFTARVKTTGQTGVEMEALTAVSAACLTLYDMVKAVDKAMTITDIQLIEKSGGASGDFKREAP